MTYDFCQFPHKNVSLKVWQCIIWKSHGLKTQQKNNMQNMFDNQKEWVHWCNLWFKIYYSSSHIMQSTLRLSLLTLAFCERLMVLTRNQFISKQNGCSFIQNVGVDTP